MDKNKAAFPNVALNMMPDNSDNSLIHEIITDFSARFDTECCPHYLFELGITLSKIQLQFLFIKAVMVILYLKHFKLNHLH